MATRHSEVVQAYRKRKLAQGKCPQCGQRKTQAGHQRCSVCRVRASELQRKIRARKLAQGLCPLCGKAKREERQLCDDCLARDNERKKEKRARLARAVVPDQCTDPVLGEDPEDLTC